MLIAKIAAAFVGGFLLHQTRPSIARLSDGWRELTSYAIGIIGSFPFAVLIHRELHGVNDVDHRFTLTWIVTFCAYGAGVAIGWLWRTLTSND